VVLCHNLAIKSVNGPLKFTVDPISAVLIHLNIVKIFLDLKLYADFKSDECTNRIVGENVKLKVHYLIHAKIIKLIHRVF